MKRIEFVQPKPRCEDWRVNLDGRSIGSVWKCRDFYRVSIAKMETALTLEQAFKAASKQIKALVKELKL